MIETIEAHSNYGKDLLSLQRDANFPLEIKLRMMMAGLRMVNNIRKEIGLISTIALFSSVKKRVTEVLEICDLSEVQKTDISESDLKEMIERIALGEEMVRRMDKEKAIKIRKRLSEELAPDFFPIMFPTYEELEQIEGAYLSNLKKFLMAYAHQNCQKNLQYGTIIEKSEEAFSLIVTGCNFAKVAELMGDIEICYWTTCVTDDFFFPVQAEQAGVIYERKGTIATGQPICDFCWKRID